MTTTAKMNNFFNFFIFFIYIQPTFLKTHLLGKGVAKNKQPMVKKIWPKSL